MTQDFERAWQVKLEAGLVDHGREDLASVIRKDGEGLTDDSPRLEVIAWTRQAIGLLEDCLPDSQVGDILTSCACHYPKEALRPLRELYKQNGDISEIHAILQAEFRQFLKGSLSLNEEEIESVLSRGWGLAGMLEGNTVTATKIPKSGYLKAYLNEQDPLRRREMYCHCPRVREAVRLKAGLPIAYCYCGAGFYKDIWETILDQPVAVKVRSSVLHGDESCTIEITLPG